MNEEPDCPLCGSEMQRKEAKHGPNIGRHFWGCVHWPFCRGLLDDDLAVPERVQALAAQRRAQITLAIENGDPRCPLCDSVMLERLNRRGSSAGMTFWGCSRYPECNGIRNTDGSESLSEEEVRLGRMVSNFLERVRGCSSAAELRNVIEQRLSEASDEHWNFVTNYWRLAAEESAVVDASLLLDLIASLPPRAITDCVCQLPAMSMELAVSTVELLGVRARQDPTALFGARDLFAAFERLGLALENHPTVKEIAAILDADWYPLFGATGPGWQGGQPKPHWKFLEEP